MFFNNYLLSGLYLPIISSSGRVYSGVVNPPLEYDDFLLFLYPNFVSLFLNSSTTAPTVINPPLGLSTNSCNSLKSSLSAFLSKYLTKSVKLALVATISLTWSICSELIFKQWLNSPIFLLILIISFLIYFISFPNFIYTFFNTASYVV